MKKVIESINDGQLDRDFGTLSLISSIEHSIHAGESCEGSFSVSVIDHNLLEGHVLSDDYRMELITDTFSGSEDQIAYRFNSSGLNPGGQVRGNFIVISNRGEFTVPFCIHIEEEILESSLGQIRNLFHFCNLAKANWEEAKNVFYDPKFENIFTESDREYRPLYKCLSGIKGSAANMDEFLVSIRKKTPVEFIPSETSIEIDEPLGMSRYSLNISRNGWGYTSFCVSAEGDFLSVEKGKIGHDDFLGNNYQLYYYVDADKLHCGRNYGTIILKDRRSETRISVVVKKASDSLGFKSMTKARRQGIMQVMEYYQARRLKKISSRVWLTETGKIVDRLLANDPQDLLARLYQIQFLQTQERNNEANWNLKSVKNAANSVKDSQPFMWCYYLYLCSLSDAYSDCYEENVAAVELCYKQNPDDWKIAWLLSFMSEEYKSMTRKWVMYEETFYRGCTSPVLYLEAAKIMLDNPTILTKLDSFEIQILRYICKKELMTEEILFNVTNLTDRIKTYDDNATRLLMFCYDKMPTDEVLSSICSQLIRGGRTDLKAFEWYARGINSGIKITRLFEYYMLSRSKEDTSEIPRTVQLYFSFHSDLDYETNSFLFAYIFDNRDKDPDMYSRYRDQINEFIEDQLEAGHNNSYLCRLYLDYLEGRQFDDEETAAKIADVLFLNEVDLSKYPEVTGLVLCYGHSDEEIKIPANGRFTEVPIYSDDYCIVLEDDMHNRYAVSKPVKPRQLMGSGRLINNLQLMLKEHTGLDTHICMDHYSTAEVRMDNEFRFKSLLGKACFSSEFRCSITMKLIRFYYDQERMEELDKFLDGLEACDLSDNERPECIRYMIKRGLYAKAMDWLYRLGPERVDKASLSALITRWMSAKSTDPEGYGNFLIQLIVMTFNESKTDMACMLFLAEKYQGDLKTLRNIRNAILTDPKACRQLEEKMIIQMLFTGAYISDREDVIKSYALSLPDGDILRAALAKLSYEYFVNDAIVKDDFFYVLTQAMDSNLELNIVCSLAYVRFYAENKKLIDDQVRPVLKYALHTCMGGNMIIPCFKELADFMPSMSHFADLTIIQYKTKATSKVDIHYAIEGSEDSDFIVESMDHIYGGVFTKAFTIFFGERLQYYITEENDGKSVLSESRTIMKNDLDDNSSTGRFGVINDICVAKILHDYVTVDETLEEYYRNDYLTSKLFGMHKG